MSSQVKLILWGVLSLAIMFGLYSVYRKGYAAAEGKYLPILEAQKRQAAELETKQKATSARVVTQYRDRVKTVTETVEKIVIETPEVLKNETNNCIIGPGFISLHNRAAQSGSLPSSTSGANGARASASSPAR